MEQRLSLDKSFSSNTTRATFCPFLGTEDDETTWLGYPHQGNYCYRVEPAGPIDPGHQQSTCLTPTHYECPIYLKGGKGPLPNGIRGEPIRNGFREKFFPWGLPIFGLSILILGVLLIIFVIQPSTSVIPEENPTIRPTTQGALILEMSETAQALAPVFSNTPEQTATEIPPTATHTQLPTNTPPPSETPTPASPTEGPGLSTPFGPSGMYLLHRIEAGESLSSIAELYDTNSAVINAANSFIEGASIWPGTMLVIIPGQKDPGEVVRFLVIQLDQETSIQELSEEFNVSPENIRNFNSLGSGDTIPAGRWLIIPVEG